MRLSALLTSAFVFVFVFVVTGTAGAQVQSETDERAAAHFHAAESYFAEESFEQALQEFEAAYRLSQRPELLYNIGLTLERLGRWSEAAEAHERFITVDPDHPSADVARERRDRALARAEATAGDGGDGAPLASEGGRDAEGSSLVPWIVLGASGAVGVAALVTGLIAHGISEDLASTCVGGVCPEDRRDDASRGETLAVTSTVLTFVALAGAATSILLFVLGGGEDEEPAPATSLGVIPLPGGGMMSGRIAL